MNLFKGISAQLVSKPVQTTDAIQNGANASDSSPNKNADHYYEMLLGLCERLFENEIEQHLFEDQMRAVFGLKVTLPFLRIEVHIFDPALQHAYKIFTVDKVIGVIIKQVGC